MQNQNSVTLLNSLQNLIGEWSMRNFGAQLSKVEMGLISQKDLGEVIETTISINKHLSYKSEEEVIDFIDSSLNTSPQKFIFPLCLNSLAPLMGITEEIGELTEQFILLNKTHENDASLLSIYEEVKDALGDICVYLCDYCEREKLNLAHIILSTKPEENAYSGCSNNNLVIANGRLYHATLKRHQGIRGFDNFEKYADAQANAISQIWRACDTLADKLLAGKPLLLILQETWEKVVSKRNWKKSPVEKVSD